MLQAEVGDGEGARGSMAGKPGVKAGDGESWGGRASTAAS